MSVVVRFEPLIGLAALIPVVAFILGRGEPMVGLAVACVLLTVTSLLLMIGGQESESQQAHTA